MKVQASKPAVVKSEAEGPAGNVDELTKNTPGVVCAAASSGEGRAMLGGSTRWCRGAEAAAEEEAAEEAAGVALGVEGRGRGRG